MPLFFIIFSVWIVITASAMGPEEKAFPLMVGCFQLLVALYQFFSELRQKQPVDVFGNSNVRKVLEAIIVMFIYVFLLKKIGYILDAFLLALYAMVTLGFKRRVVAVMVSVIISLVTFVVFKMFLKVPLPMVVLNF